MVHVLHNSLSSSISLTCFNILVHFSLLYCVTMLLLDYSFANCYCLVCFCVVFCYVFMQILYSVTFKLSGDLKPFYQ